MSEAGKNPELLQRISEGDRTAEELMIKENMGLVRSIALRFVGRGQDLEDLVQIGAVGMLKAVRGYNKSYGTVFSTYAVPMITGEIKRFLRDDGIIKVGREAKRNYVRLMSSKDKYIRNYGEEPRLSVLCQMCDISEEDAVYAIEACSGVVSLNEKIGDDEDACLEDFCEDQTIGDVVERVSLMQAIEELSKNDREIIYMRYFKGMTQSQVAKVMGLTQVKVSRQEKRIISALKELLKCG